MKSLAVSPFSNDRNPLKQDHGEDKLQENWLRAIVDNDIHEAKTILDQCSSEQAHRLVNGLNMNTKSTKTEEVRLTLQKPLHIAIQLLRDDIVSLLMQRGASALETDIDDTNVLHTLCWGAYDHVLAPDAVLTEKDYCNFYEKHFLRNLDDPNWPLELAAKLGCGRLMLSFLNTPEMYMMKTNELGYTGTVETRLYRVTEYEVLHTKNSRSNRHPLHLITQNWTYESMARESTNCFLQTQLFEDWRITKQNQTVALTLIWFICRFFYGTSLLLHNSIMLQFTNEELKDQRLVNQAFEGRLPENCTKITNNQAENLYLLQPAPQLTMVYILLFGSCSIFWLIYDLATYYNLCMGLCNTAQWRKIIRTPFRSPLSGLEVKMAGRRISDNRVYTISITFCSIYLVVCIATVSLDPMWHYFIVLGTMPTTFMVALQAVYFLQLIPTFSVYLVTMQKLFEDLANFMILLVLLYIPFTITKDLIGVVHCEGQPVHGRQVVEQFYTLFKMWLNIIDTPKAYCILHVIFVMLIAVLTINYLIAMFSNTVAVVSEYTSETLRLTRLDVALTVASRVGPFFSRVAPSYYRRHFVEKRTKNGDEVFLKCRVLRRADTPVESTRSPAVL